MLISSIRDAKPGHCDVSHLARSHSPNFPFWENQTPDPALRDLRFDLPSSALGYCSRASTSVPRKLAHAAFAPSTTDAVQNAQRRAWIGISLRHSGHLRVVGSTGTGSLLVRATKVLIGSTTRKYTAAATIT